MKKPVLVVMAAGMGSRYGGIKQIDPVGPNDQLIIDYSVYDAKKAGFESVVFIIKHEIEKAFKEAIGDRLSKIMNVKYAYQSVDDVPEGFELPEGRVKPWGTSHAIYAAREIVDGPFAVINADDYYGPKGFQLVYDFLTENTSEEDHCMVGYYLKNTVTENGSVSRGVCTVKADDTLEEIEEYLKIELKDGKIKYTEDDGASYKDISGETVVSMNLWGFKRSYIDEISEGFKEFLIQNKDNITKSEYYIGSTISKMINEDTAKVHVLYSGDKWHGVTYKEDKPSVINAIKEKTEQGLYPEDLWA